MTRNSAGISTLENLARQENLGLSVQVSYVGFAAVHLLPDACLVRNWNRFTVPSLKYSEHQSDHFEIASFAETIDQ
jgi:hypothetical protein